MSTLQTNAVREMIKERKKGNNSSRFIEKIVPLILLLTAVISVLTTLGIMYTLISESIAFFGKVSFKEFFTSTEWLPFMSSNPKFGILPLLIGTLKVTIIAMIVAIPVGLASAVYLSEYASDNARRVIKPILEVLAGIPTIVYGFFALTFVTPLLQKFIPSLEIFNALSPGIVMGIMIIPMVASLSEDAMTAVPKALREGALGLGSTKFEVAVKIVIPAALSGIISSFVLAFSRAIGETMIVSVAGGSTPGMGMDVTQSIQTMTAYMVQVSGGDISHGSITYDSIYAVGITLFVFTLGMNMFSQYVSRRFKEEY